MNESFCRPTMLEVYQTSSCAMHDEGRPALRRITDGHGERNRGVDGGRTIPWRGRCSLIGAPTSWGESPAVFAVMGDRLLLTGCPVTYVFAAAALAFACAVNDVVMPAQQAARGPTLQGRR